MPRPSQLDDPHYAAFAWGRYWMLMRWMALVTGIIIVVALGFLYASNGWVSVHLYIATGLGIAAAMLSSAGLMGLVFLSSGSGHDETIEDPLESEVDIGD
ncbi:hypothetical protein [Novosphingopyxis sp. YJ-S2-01]|uniref:hypothetical protein n=1 Tax=Novosphingopyxis sp. YJ-S2-01 TaxID=2794021 RepID=UPI0018DE4F82|nr:hypothetical protein [Novosphingopyxis sp. YJ-S2-01]MBH9537322.1 hypothetical protein [Novosphingopyxis sp. YJ-S2-01]